MQPIWNAIVDHVSRNWEAYSGALGALTLATIVCMPAKMPRTLDELWAWARSSLQTAIPARHAPPTNVDPTQPATAPEKDGK